MELHQCLYAYLEELQNGRRVSASTYDAYRRDLEHAMSYLEGQGLSLDRQRAKASPVCGTLS